MRRHVKASSVPPIRQESSRIHIGLICAAMLALVAFLGIGVPSASAVDTCPNVIFRTGPSAKLPECRAYELVTPTYTGGQPPTAMGFLGNLPGMFATDNVTPAGDSVVYNTIGGPLTGFSGTGIVDRYRARRTAQGWATESISPGGDQMTGEGPGGISPDHEYAVGQAQGGTEKLWPPFGGGGFMYLRTPGGYEPLARGSLGDAQEAWSDWISPGATHIIFTSKAKLEPDAPDEETQAVYDRTPGGPTHVVSLLPDGSTPRQHSEYLGEAKGGAEIAFTTGFPGEEGRYPVFVRRDNAVTKEAIRPGGVAVGKELKCTGGPGGATLEYEWLRNGSAIGANSPTYTTTTADEGSVVQCQVTASDPKGTSIATSVTRVVDPYQGKTFPSQSSVAITPSGSTAAAGSPLTCGGGGSGFTVAYQWFKDGAEVLGASASAYVPVEADVGHTLQCRVAVSNANGTSVGFSSSVAIYKAVPKASANPAITDLSDPGQAPEVGDELSCSQGTWSNSPSFSYEWLGNGAEISGATSSTYTVEAGDEGKALQCRVTATNAVGSTRAVSGGMFFGGTESETHPFLEAFGSAAQPSFSYATSVAVDQSSGDLLVVDPEAGTLSRFKPDGTPDDFSARATNVISGTPEGPLAFPFAEERRRSSVQVAVDNSGGATQGDIYLATGTESESRIDIFSPTGVFLGKLDQYKEGADASGSLTPFSARACGVAVAPNGTVYAADSGGFVHKYVPGGAFPTAADNTANFSYSEACALAAGAGPTAGFVFVTSYGGGEGELAKLDASTGEAKYTLASGVRTVSVDPPSGHVYALKGFELQEFDASGPASASSVSVTEVNGQGVAIRGSNTHIFVPKSGDVDVSVYGPGIPFTPEPPDPLSGVTIFGAPQVGNSLFCGTGSWSGNPTFAYQWLRNGAEISGATSGGYALTAEDLETVIQCQVTATNEVGAAVAIDANEGAKVVTGALPVAANASLPDPGYTFDGIFNGRVFYDDTYTDRHEQEYSKFGNLYMYDLDAEKTSTILGSGDGAIVNVSEDGSHVYFISKSLIDGEGEAGKPNLGVWSAATESAKFIATVSEQDVTSIGQNQTGSLTTWWMALSANTFFNRGRAMDHSRSTPDGTVFAFESTAQLTGFDNIEESPDDCGAKDIERKPIPGQPCDEVYRYDTQSEELTCVSCGPGAGPATGNARLQTINEGGGLLEGEEGPASINSPVESLTSDGDTVFFESNEGLVPRDGNEAKDVYRWKKGDGLALISTGQGVTESALYGVTPSGSDVIFGTREKLLPQDENGSTSRLYDARVEGGFPPPEETVTEPCTGDACQGQAAAAPEPPNVASSSLNGGGNVAQKPKCGRHARRVVRKGSERCVQRKHRRHRRAHHKRRAAR